MSHTPGKMVQVDGQPLCLATTDEGQVVADVADHHWVDAEANAERIVLCWNCHNDLVNELRAALRTLDSVQRSLTAWDFSEQIERGSAILAKAEAKI